jgi:hypothetical protein
MFIDQINKTLPSLIPILPTANVISCNTFHAKRFVYPAQHIIQLGRYTYYQINFRSVTMLQLPALIPAGSAYVRIPRSKSAAMRILLETVQRGSRYWIGGVIPIDKALRLADKFAQYYATNASQSKRSWNKAHGRANCTLIMYPDNDQNITHVRWWLLVTPGIGLVYQEEKLQDCHDPHQRLMWGEQYELLHLQHLRGGGRRWTWQMQKQRNDEMTKSMSQYASGHGHFNNVTSKNNAHESNTITVERTDNLGALIHAIKLMPGFHGIRMQQMHLYAVGRECWNKSHTIPYMDWPTAVPYVDKRQFVYHRPNALKLDVLVKIANTKSHFEIDCLSKVM